MMNSTLANNINVIDYVLDYQFWKLNVPYPLSNIDSIGLLFDNSKSNLEELRHRLCIAGTDTKLINYIIRYLEENVDETGLVKPLVSFGFVMIMMPTGNNLNLYNPVKYRYILNHNLVLHYGDKAKLEIEQYLQSSYKMTKRVFISQPFTGVSMNEIEFIRNDVVVYLGNMCKRIGVTSPYTEIIDNYNKPEHDENNRLWCLGDSIQQLGTADLVVFSNNYESARGCQIEMEIVKKYNIPYIILPDESVMESIRRGNCNNLVYEQYVVDYNVQYLNKSDAKLQCLLGVGFSNEDARNNHLLFKLLKDFIPDKHYVKYDDYIYNTIGIDLPCNGMVTCKLNLSDIIQ